MQALILSASFEKKLKRSDKRLFCSSIKPERSGWCRNRVGFYPLVTCSSARAERHASTISQSTGGASGKISCWLSKNQMISEPKSPPKVTSSHLTAARRPAGARVSERRLTAKVELLPTWPSQPPSSGVQLAMKALWMARFGVLVKEKALVTWSTRAHSPHQYMHSHTGVVSSQSLNPLLNHKKRG